MQGSTAAVAATGHDAKEVKGGNAAIGLGGRAACSSRQQCLHFGLNEVPVAFQSINHFEPSQNAFLDTNSPLT